jgi:hypothetical protein
MEADMSDIGQRLVSPHGFDGRGPVPWEVTQAATQTARLRVMFLTQDGGLTRSEVDELFSAAAILAEWTRELYEVVHPAPLTDGSEK